MFLRKLTIFTFLIFAPGVAFGALQGGGVTLATVEPVLEVSSPEISYSELIANIDAGKISSVEIPISRRSLDGVMADGTVFSVIMPVDRKFADQLVAAGIETRFSNNPISTQIADPGQYFWWALMDIVPFLIFVIFFVFAVFWMRKGNQKILKQRNDDYLANFQNINNEYLVRIEKIQGNFLNRLEKILTQRNDQNG